MAKANKMQYQAKNGNKQWKPSIELAMALAHDSMGFCLSCADEVPNVEPDAGKYLCPSCGAHKVYGAEQLAIMGLTY